MSFKWFGVSQNSLPRRYVRFVNELPRTEKGASFLDHDQRTDNMYILDRSQKYIYIFSAGFKQRVKYKFVFRYAKIVGYFKMQGSLLVSRMKHIHLKVATTWHLLKKNAPQYTFKKQFCQPSLFFYFTGGSASSAAADQEPRRRHPQQSGRGLVRSAQEESSQEDALQLSEKDP